MSHLAFFRSVRFIFLLLNRVGLTHLSFEIKHILCCPLVTNLYRNIRLRLVLPIQVADNRMNRRMWTETAEKKLELLTMGSILPRKRISFAIQTCKPLTNMHTYFNYEEHVAIMPQEKKRYRKKILFYNSSGKENQNYCLTSNWKIFYIKSKLNIDLKYSIWKTKQKCLKKKKSHSKILQFLVKYFHLF